MNYPMSLSLEKLKVIASIDKIDAPLCIDASVH